MEVKTRGFWKTREIRIGPLEVYPKTAPSLRGTRRGDSVFVRYSYSFRLMSPGGDEWEGDCHGGLGADRLIQGDLKYKGTPLFNWKSIQGADFFTACTFWQEPAGEVAELKLAGDSSRIDRLGGQLKAPNGSYRIVSHDEKLRSGKSYRFFSGYRFDREGRTEGAVAITHPQGVWVRTEAPLQDSTEIALAAAALLLHPEPSKLLDMAVDMLSGQH